jgi:hypothetical protein
MGLLGELAGQMTLTAGVAVFRATPPTARTADPRWIALTLRGRPASAGTVVRRDLRRFGRGRARICAGIGFTARRAE